MEIKDLIAILALIVSLFTLYWTNLRRARISCSPFRLVRIVIPQKGNPQMRVPFIITNTGGATAVVDYLFLQVNCVDHNDEITTFWALSDEDNPVWMRTSDDLKKLILPFALKPGDSATRNIWFILDKPNFIFNAGKYEIEIFANLAGKKKPKLLQSQKLLLHSNLHIGTDISSGYTHAAEIIDIS
jgi:hypothetical protein